ncbi:MAG: sigma-70 family RNA polymerase sigma factor, partial [Bacillota bacterium]|nr:sigma-70 family RNA polymerase sigma factor [Bacillota bacterium]
MDYLDLWKRFKEKGDSAAKDELIVSYVPLVKNIAGRLYGSFHSQVEYDDIVGYGIIGLIDAVEKFDYKKNIKFETYASIRIRGSVVDYLRTNDWIPRSLRAKYKKVEEIMERLQEQYDGEISDS